MASRISASQAQDATLDIPVTMGKLQNVWIVIYANAFIMCNVLGEN